MKKLLSLLLALALILPLGTSARAAQTDSGVSVMWNGEYIEFTDAYPTVRDNRTMIPIRAFMEAAGAEVDYADRTVYLTLEDGSEISFVIGETTAQVTRGGETRTIVMDTKTFIEDNRSYVPLRFFSEALGYDVYWDADSRTAVVIDSDALIAAADARFTYLNGILASSGDIEGAYTDTASVSGYITLFDEYGTSYSMPFSAQASAVVSDMGSEETLTYDLSTLSPFFVSMYGEDADTDDIDALLTGEIRALADGASGDVYAQYPEAIYDIMRYGGAEIPEGAWVYITAEDVDSALLPLGNIASGGSVTVGSILYSAAAANYGAADIYGGFTEVCESLALLFGDEQFAVTEDGAALDIALGDIETDGFTLTVSVTISNDGSAVGSVTLDALYDEETTLTFEIAFSSYGGVTVASVSLTVPDVMSVTADIISTVTASDAEPDITPPDGAVIVPLSDITGEE